ncbi:glycosyltransferase [Campylobacter lari]|uniref:Glycosyltransferase n=1 Tax=Campylobacter lari TaxID=201 RepID=A0A6N6BE06_CAMLA|nr:glycosyltransferase [Campylobacter lari]
MFVIYDFTRLDQRRNLSTPSGVDRVDLYYILFLLKNYNKIIFVRGYGGYLKTYSTQSALDILKKIAKNWAEIDNISYDIDKNDFVNVKIDVEKILKNNIQYTYFNLTHSLLIGRYTIAKFAIKDNIKMIYFCHDMTPITHPEYHAEGMISFKQHSCAMKLMLWSADLILTTSQAVEQDILNYSIEIGVNPPKVVAKEIGAEENFLKARWNKHDSHKHFIYVGTFEPRKNHILLFLAWKKLYSILQENTPMLYIIGKKGWLIDWLDRYFEVEPNVSRFVKRLENIQDSQLEKLMLESYATLNSSYAEGWGMPVAESVSMGVPTICSDIPAYHESSQECAIFLSPLNVDIWVDTILDILNNRAVFPDKMYKIPTWKNYFIEIDKILNGNCFLRDKTQYIQFFYDNLEDFHFAAHKIQLNQKNKKTFKDEIRLKLLKSKLYFIRILARFI